MASCVTRQALWPFKNAFDNDNDGGREDDGSRLMLYKLSDPLPKKLLLGEVKGLCPPGRPRSSFNNIALRDCPNCRTGRPYRDA